MTTADDTTHGTSWGALWAMAWPLLLTMLANAGVSLLDSLAGVVASAYEPIEPKFNQFRAPVAGRFERFTGQFGRRRIPVRVRMGA